MTIKTCDCKHEFQDKEYGIGKRVHIPNNRGYGCTVCGKDKIASSSAKSSKSSKGK